MQASTVTAADGLNLAVQEWGNPRGPEVLFIHGFNQAHLSWLRQVKDPQLAAEFRMITFDLRGHGSSDKPLEKERYAHQNWGDDVAAIMRATCAAPAGAGRLVIRRQRDLRLCAQLRQRGPRRDQLRGGGNQGRPGIFWFRPHCSFPTCLRRTWRPTSPAHATLCMLALSANPIRTTSKPCSRSTWSFRRACVPG